MEQTELSCSLLGFLVKIKKITYFQAKMFMKCAYFWARLIKITYQVQIII